MCLPISAPQRPLLPPQGLPSPRPLPGLGRGLPTFAEPAARRDRIWELSPSLHCSIIGTCLTTSALRQLFAKLNLPDAKTASDHALHSRAVCVAGQQDLAGKLLNRMLEKRHETHIRRFARAKTTAELRVLWLEALERGDIAGGYWAVLTHPATDQALVAEVFGEVHMLSHLVGMSNRADIVRLRALEGELGQRDEKIARQETRLQRMAQQRDALTRQIEGLECALSRRHRPIPESEAEHSAQSALRQRLADEQTRSAQLAARLAEQGLALADRDREVERLQAQAAALRHELAALEAGLANLGAAAGEAAEAAPDLGGKRLLYVGGRPRQIEQLRSLAERLGGTLLTHDGGIEDNTALLPGLVSQANAAFFPVDCVSHRAAGRVKRLCREAGKPFVPLRSASLGSFLTAVAGLDERMPETAVAT